MKSLLRRFKRYISKNNQNSTYKVAKQNEFISWLSFANAGMLDTGNLYCFEYAIENIPSLDPIVEIGSFCGLSTNIISHYLKINNKQNKLITCDKWIFEGAEKPSEYLTNSTISHSQYKNFVKESFLRNISFFSKDNLPNTIECFSDEFFDLWKDKKIKTDVLGHDIQLGGNISFAYIDGNHTYEFAKKDFENVDKYLVKGGFILFDDSADNSHWEVCRVIEEIKKAGKYEVIIKNPNYLMRKLV